MGGAGVFGSEPKTRRVRITRPDVLVGTVVRQPGDVVEIAEGTLLDSLFETGAAVSADFGGTPDPASFARRRMGIDQ